MAIKIFTAVFSILSLFLGSIESVSATAAVTAATGGSAISADTAGGSYTSLTGSVISEGATADIGTGTIILNVPSGFIFDTGGTAPTVLVTRIAGSGTNTRNINDVASGTSLAITSITTTQITFTVTASTSNGVRNSLTWQNIRVRPSAGTPLAIGNITKSGTSSIVGVTGSTNFGTLTEVAGAKSQITITTQPSSSAVVNTDFTTKPVVAIQDQFGNTVTSDNSTTITRTAVLSTQTCGGTAGSGTLTSTPASGAAVTAGVMTYTAMQYSFGESIKICVSSSGITSALSDAITVNNPTPTTTSISPTSKTAGDTGFTLTVNGTNFVSNSTVRFNGSSRTTTFVNSTQLTASILTSDLTTAGTFPITVFNTTPGGGTSNSQTFTVNVAGDTTAPAAISDLATSNATNNSIELSWTAPGDDNNTGTATTYNIRYSTSVITSGNFDSATAVTGEPTPSIVGTAESMTVSGLSPSTTYFFAMKTSDEVPNTSSISNVPSGTTTATPDTTAPAAISDLAVSSVTTSSATLTWTAPGDDSSTGTATTYDVRYSTSLITSPNFSSARQATGEPSPSIAGSSETFTVTGLSAGTTYFFAMKTSDEVPNTSSISNVPSGTTTAAGDTTAPAAIADLATSNIPTSSIDLSWTAPGDDNSTGTATTYDIRYSTSLITDGNFSSATAVTGEPTPSIAGTAESMTVSGLSANTTYYFAMKTSDEVPNASAISNVPSATTLASGDTTAPSAITDLALSNPTTSSIKLTWTASGDDNNTGTATSYDIRFSTAPISDGNFSSATQVSGEPTPQTAGTSQSMTVSGLSADTTYYFAMKTSDEVPNTSGLSNNPSLSTSSEVISPVIIPEPGAGGGVLPTQVLFSGQAYPGGRVKFFRRSAIDVQEQNIFVLDTETTADSNGKFSKQFLALLQGTYFFAVEAQDKDGRSSGILGFTADLIGTGKLLAENIFTPPTVGFDPPEVTRGKDLKVLGYASPNSAIEVEVDRILRYNTKAKSDGSYEIFINTSRYSAKDHFLRAWQIDSSGRQSPISSLKSFKITLLANPRADFNSDSIINIVDWSIFLFRWRATDVDLKKTIDLNGDGKVTGADLSSFLKAIKGL